MVKIKKVYTGFTKLNYGKKSNKIQELRYEIKGSPISRNELKEYLETELKRVEEKMGTGYQVMVNATFGDRNRSSHWYVGKPSDLSENLNIVDPDSYGADWEFEDIIYQFALYFSRKLPQDVGADKHNDCLWMALYKAFGGHVPDMKFPRSLKIFLNLDRNEKVPLSLIPKLEDKFNTRIHVHGDYEYTSPKDYTRVIYLKTKGSHISLSHHESKSLLQAVSFDEHNLIVYYFDNNKYHTYDGEEFNVLEVDEYVAAKREIRSKPRSCPYFMINSKSTDLKAEYDKFVINANRLRDKTKGLINLYKCQGSMKMCILRLFYNCSRCFEAQPMTPQEMVWTDNALIGGLVWAIKETKLDYAYSYDFNSKDPSVMNSNVFPLQEGEFFLLEELPEKLKYGIYRAVITGHDYRLFKTNDNNSYAHHCLKRARELKYKIDLIQDGNANALLYLKGKVSGKKLFGPTIDTLYPLKMNWVKSPTESSNPIGKLLSMFWGSLAQKRIYLHDTEKGGEITITKNVMSITPTKDGEHLVKCRNRRLLFMTNYARVAPFITSLARYQMSKHLEPNINNIHRVHTDGYVVDKKLNFTLSKQLGELKLEHEGRCYIKNCRDVLWNDDI